MDYGHFLNYFLHFFCVLKNISQEMASKIQTMKAGCGDTCLSMTLTFHSQRQEDWEFKASLGYSVPSPPTKNKQTKNPGNSHNEKNIYSKILLKNWSIHKFKGR
jgi:hypothetical protein